MHFLKIKKDRFKELADELSSNFYTFAGFGGIPLGSSDLEFIIYEKLKRGKDYFKHFMARNSLRTMFYGLDSESQGIPFPDEVREEVILLEELYLAYDHEEIKELIEIASQKLEEEDERCERIKINKARRKEASKVLASKHVRSLIMEKFNHKCVLCGTGEGLSIDHIVSLNKGGKDTLDNFQVLCRICNSRKGG